MPHVLVAGKIHDAGMELLRQAPGVTLEYVTDSANAAYLPFLPKADALLLRTQPLTAKHLASAPRLTIVSRHGVGYDAVDLAALDARRIPLAIVGDVNSRAVAEHAMMLMLSAARRIVFYDTSVKSGDWQARNAFDAVELDGKRLLIMGFGRIGRRLAELAKAFGMIVAAHDPFVSIGHMQELGVEPAGDRAAALTQTDYLSLHIPADPKGAVIGAAELALMKPSAILVNAARGGLINEIALDEALRERRIFAAGLDVLSTEPPGKDHPLLSNPFVTISPHNAGLTAECAKRMAIAAAHNILDHFEGRLDKRLIVNQQYIA